MKTETLPADWTISEPTPMMHGHWYSTFYHGRKMSLVLIQSDHGRWMIQNAKGTFPSAADAINHAVCIALKKSGQLGWSRPDYRAD